MSGERLSGDGEKSDEDKEGQPKEDPQADMMQEYEELVRQASCKHNSFTRPSGPKHLAAWHCRHQPHLLLSLVFSSVSGLPPPR